MRGRGAPRIRKNPPVELIDAGRSEDEIVAITGYQSSEMVRLEGRYAHPKKLAE